MAGGIKQYKKGELLFREGDPSDAMYVIRKGRISILKSKGASTVTLAELAPGEMLGEMAFFDNKPRSASAQAAQDSEVIILPFAALHAQFKTFPEWLRAMVKTVNSHLRNANQTIKNLQSADVKDVNLFDPYSITRLCAIISLIGFKAGEQTEKGIVIPFSVLRNYCIQIFQQPTHRLEKLMEVLIEKEFMTLEELGEGRRKITLLKHKELTEFTDWYNEFLFKEESKRTPIDEKELVPLKALVFYGEKVEPDKKNKITVNLTHIQNESMKDLGHVVPVSAFDSLIDKKLCEEKQSVESGQVAMSINYPEIVKITPYWDLIYTLLKVPHL